MVGYVSEALAKMRAGGAQDIELAAFRRRLEQLGSDAAGQIPGSTLEPLDSPCHLADLDRSSGDLTRQVLNRLVVIKLNGGLGTSMGLSGPKSLIEIRPGATFLDVIAKQVLAIGAKFNARVPLAMMNSAVTRVASLEALKRYAVFRSQAIPLDFLQGSEPKLRADNFRPVSWPADPSLEWCPAGHGDLYTAIAAGGLLRNLLDAGIRWCFVANSDNLGACPDPRIATWIAREEIPFVMEVVRGTPADRKGGHLAQLNGRIILRESAQVPPGDTSFGRVDHWKYFNTNNLWFDLEVLKDLQLRDPALPSLPLIVNKKTVDPSDPKSAPVLQLETAMGAAIGSISGAQVIEVPRTRFAPVKTTDDLLVVRSDAYTLESDGRMIPAFGEKPPLVRLDRAYYGMLHDFETRFPSGPPSLCRCTSLEVEGDVTFGAAVVIEGDVKLVGKRRLGHGARLRG